MKKYRVFLFRSPNCIRGWLAYVDTPYSDRATFTGELLATTGAVAKNKAITAANRGFTGVAVVGRNHADVLWGIDNFPELRGL